MCLRVYDARTCSNLPYYLTFLQRSCGTNPFHHLCMQVCTAVCTQLSLSVCVVHAHDMCSAAVLLLCVCVCRIRVRVRTCHTTSPSSSVPAVQIPSITCVCTISYVNYASPATAVRPVTSVRVFQHVTSYTCVQRNPCAHCHHIMRPSSPNSAVPLQGTKYEHPIGDILRLKAKVAD